MRKLIAHQCCYQLTAVKTRYPLTSITWPYRGLRCLPIQIEYFLKVSADKLLVFKWSQAHFLKFIWNMLCLCHYGPALLTFLFQTDIGRENSASCLKIQAGKTDAFHFSHHGHAPRPIFMLWLVKIWQVSSCGKFMQHLGTCLLWQLRLTKFCVDPWCFQLSFSSWCTKWNTAAINSLLLFMAAGLFIEFLVEKCAACQSRKSDFGRNRFCFSPCWMRKRIIKAQAILALLDSFQELHLETW